MQADAIEASARELIAKLLEELPPEECEAHKEGNFIHFSVIHSLDLLIQLLFPFFHN